MRAFALQWPQIWNFRDWRFAAAIGGAMSHRPERTVQNENRFVRHRLGNLLAAIPRPPRSAGRLPGADRRELGRPRRGGGGRAAWSTIRWPPARRPNASRREGVEIVFLYVSTYALSSTVLPVVQRVAAPVVVLNLQPVPQLDYAAFNALGDRGRMTGIWLEHCQACSAPEIACVFNRAGVAYHLVTGYLRRCDGLGRNRRVGRGRRGPWRDAGNRVGILGHPIAACWTSIAI